MTLSSSIQDFIKNYNIVSPAFEDTLKQSAKKLYMKLSADRIVNMYEALSQTIEGIIQTFDCSLDCEDSDVDTFCSVLGKFLAFTVFNAYLDGFDHDRIMTGDVKFGFALLGDVIVSFTETEGLPASDSVSAVEISLTQLIRDTSLNDYLTNGLYHNDMQQVSMLLSSSPDDKADWVKVAEIVLQNSSSIRMVYEDSYKRTCDVYEKVLEPGYAMHRYWGVLGERKINNKTIGNGFTVARKNKAGRLLQRVEYASMLSVPFEMMKNRLGFIVSEERQFNNELILDSAEPVYFPFKIIEFVLAKASTYSLNREFYSDVKPEDKKGYSVYADKYVNPLFERLYKCGITLALLRSGVLKEENFPRLINDEDYRVNFAYNELVKSELTTMVRDVIQKLERSYCLMFVVTELNESLNTALKCHNINKLVVRVSDPFGVYKPEMANMFFGNMLTSSTKTATGTGFSVDNSIVVTDYRVVLNSSVSSAPLFGYKAVKMFKELGKTLDRDNILLGERIDGTDFIARKTDDNSFQSNLVHYIAGTAGSGKGVMTMNMIASFIAGGVPVFYIDRKPDMSGLFQYLTEGNMFIVNGGQYVPEYDCFKVFGKDSQALATWRDVSCKLIPDYLKELFGVENKDISDYYVAGDFALADLIYLRAVLLTAGIIQARQYFKGANGAIYEKLGGDRGVFVVVDEMTNFENNFETSFWNTRRPVWLEKGYIGAKAFGKVMTQKEEEAKETKRINLQSKLDSLKAALREAQEDPKTKGSKIAKLSNDIKATEKHIYNLDHAKILDLDIKLYASQFMQMLEDSSERISTLTKSGWRKNSDEVRNSNMLFIGQSLKKQPFPTSNRFVLDSFLTADGATLKQEFVGSNPAYTKSFVVPFAPDYFIGFNGDDMLSNLKEEYLNNKARCFAYVPTNESFQSEWLVGSAPSTTTVFKPYLVLNTSFECDPDNPIKTMDASGNQINDPRFKYVTDLAKACGVENWKAWRVDHLKNPQDTSWGTLEDGIGFQGLITEIMSASTGGAISADFDFKTGLGESKQIADYVAQACGYSNYQEFLFDLSPRGLFSTKDIQYALEDPNYFTDYEKRLSFYSKYKDLGAMGLITGESLETAQSSFNMGSGRTDFGDLDDDDSYDEDDSDNRGFGGIDTQSVYTSPTQGVVPQQQTSYTQSAQQSSQNNGSSSNPFYNNNVYQPYRQPTSQPVGQSVGQPAGQSVGQPQRSAADRYKEQYNMCVGYLNEVRRTLPTALIEVFRVLPDEVKAVISIQEVMEAYIYILKDTFKTQMGINVDDA